MFLLEGGLMELGKLKRMSREQAPERFRETGPLKWIPRLGAVDLKTLPPAVMHKATVRFGMGSGGCLPQW